MPDLIFVFRSVPSERDLFWQALRASGLVAEAVTSVSQLAPFGIAVARLESPRADANEMDRDVARAGAAKRQAEAVETLERELSALHPKIVAFVGLSLYAAALGARAEEALAAVELDTTDEGRPSDRSSLTFKLRVPFAGAVAVALPAASRTVRPDVLLHCYKSLARLRGERSDR